MALTNKQQVFVDEYFKCWNATKAAIAAGYSETTARAQGSRLLTNADIAAYIRERLDQHAMSANEVLYHLAQIARGDMSDLIDRHGNIDVDAARAAEKTGLIRRVKVMSITGEENDTFSSEIESYDRLKALELIGKYHAMWTDKVKVDDWRSEVVDLLRSGKVTREALVSELGTSLAEELFNSIGVSIADAGEDSAR